MRVNLKQGVLKEELATHDIHYVQGNNIAVFNGNWELNINSQHLFWSNNEFSIHGLVIKAHHYIRIIDAHLLIHPEDAAYLEYKFDELNKGAFLNDYFRLITPAGETKIIECKVTIGTAGEKSFFKGIFNNTGPDVWMTDNLTPEGFSARAYECAEQMVQLGIWEINLHDHHTVYSKHIYRIHDTVPGSLKVHPDTFRKFIHPEDRMIVTDTLDKALRHRLPFNLEYRIITYKGDLKYISQVSRLTNNETGQELLTGVTIDITEKKLLELAFREARESMEFEQEVYKQAERITQSGVWQTNLSTRKTLFSENFYRLYGLRPGLFKDGHDNFTNYIYYEDRELVAQSMKSAFEDHEVPQIMFRIFRPDGKLRYMNLQGKLIANANEDLVMVGYTQDITDHEALRKKYKKATHKQAINHEIIMHLDQAGAVGYWQLDLQTNELMFSDNFFRLYGLKPQSGPISFEHFDKYIHPDDHNFIKEIYSKILTERWSVPMEYKIITPDGQLRHLKAENKMLKTGEGFMVLIRTIRDVTEQINSHNEQENRIQFIELLSDSIPEMLIVTDLYHNILLCNRKFEDFYEVKREEINYRNVFDILPALKIPSVTNSFIKALAGEPVDINNTTVFSGKVLDIDVLPLKEQHETIMGLVIILHDRTEEADLRERMGKNTYLLQSIVENLTNRVIVFDENLDCLIWNIKCEEYFNISAKEIVGKNILDFFRRLNRILFTTIAYTRLKAKHCMLPLVKEASYRVTAPNSLFHYGMRRKKTMECCGLGRILNESP